MKKQHFYTQMISSVLLFSLLCGCQSIKTPPQTDGGSSVPTETPEIEVTVSDTERTEIAPACDFEQLALENLDLSNVDKRPLYSSYSSSDIDAPPADLYSFTTAENEKVLYIPAWEQYYRILLDDSVLLWADIVGDSVFVVTTTPFVHFEEEEKPISVYKIDKASGATQISAFDLEYLPDVQSTISACFGAMLDEENGYMIFILVENAGLSLGKIYRTEDGGVTWQELTRHESWYRVGHKDTHFVGHFFDRDHGLIALQMWERNYSTSIRVTLDGGKTWQKANLPYEEYREDYYTNYSITCKLRKFGHENGVYSLEMCMSIYDKETQTSSEEWITFTSSDFIHWQLLK